VTGSSTPIMRDQAARTGRQVEAEEPRTSSRDTNDQISSQSA
jgi:hypothetical protein